MFITQYFAQTRSSGISTLAVIAVLGTSLVAGNYLVRPAFAEGHDATGDITTEGSHGGGSGNHDDGHEEGDHEDGHTGGPGDRGGSDSHDGGHEEDDHEGGHTGGPTGAGGHVGGSDGEGEGGGGAQWAKGQGNGTGGVGAGAEAGRPVWAREGIPEIELGRLNVARSPERVIDRAFQEALGSFTSDMVEFYRLDLDDMTEELSKNWDEVNFIFSPLQNLALFREALGGTSVLTKVGVETDNDTLLAVFLGTASDKNIPITPQTAYAVSVLLGQPLDQSAAKSLAAEAESIRQAILAGHG